MARSVKSCLTYGCFGCLFAAAGVAVVVLVLVGVALIQGPAERRIERAALAAALPPDLVVPGLPERLPADPTLLPPQGVGRVVLDLSLGNFEVVAGPLDGGIHVDGSYDANSYELEQELRREDDGSWTFELGFGRKSGWLGGVIFREDENDNRIRLTLPSEVPFRLTGVIGVGESRLDLGGLWITATELDIGIGAHAFDFGDEPMPFPMERFELSASIGELSVRHLGNASPREVSMSHRLGEVELDLGGAWQADATVDLSCGIGECRVGLPDDVHVEIEQASIMIGDRTVPRERAREFPPGTPRLALRVRQTLGELTLGLLERREPLEPRER